MKEVIYNTEFTTEFFKQRTISEIREILSIFKSTPICISLAWCYWYSLFICYKHKQDIEKLPDWSHVFPPILENSSGYWNELLLLEMYRTELGIEVFIPLYESCISMKMDITEKGSTFRRKFLGSRRNHVGFIDSTFNLFIRYWSRVFPSTLTHSSGYWNQLFLLEMYRRELRIEVFLQLYERCISMKMGIIEEGSKFRRKFLSSRKNSVTFIDRRMNLFISCSNSEMFLSVSCMIDSVSISEKDEYSHIVDDLPILETNLERYSRTTADRTYYAQFLIFISKIKKAISELEDVIGQEGVYSLSVVIWPKYVYAIGFLDETLSNELLNLSAEYVVFPTNLYARYLLVKACSALGWEEQSRYNMDELTILRERYSRFKEWKPMLNIMSNIFG